MTTQQFSTYIITFHEEIYEVHACHPHQPVLRPRKLHGSKKLVCWLVKEDEASHKSLNQLVFKTLHAVIWPLCIGTNTLLSRCNMKNHLWKLKH